MPSTDGEKVQILCERSPEALAEAINQLGRAIVVLGITAVGYKQFCYYVETKKSLKKGE